jgi:hypothetical protein
VSLAAVSDFPVRVFGGCARPRTRRRDGRPAKTQSRTGPGCRGFPHASRCHPRVAALAVHHSADPHNQRGRVTRGGKRRGVYRSDEKVTSRKSAALRSFLLRCGGLGCGWCHVRCLANSASSSAVRSTKQYDRAKRAAGEGAPRSKAKKRLMLSPLCWPSTPRASSPVRRSRERWVLPTTG